jgi:hypothetical protein
MSDSQAGGTGFSVALGVMAIFGCGAFASFYLSGLVRPDGGHAPAGRPAVYSPSPAPEAVPRVDCDAPEAEARAEEVEPSPRMPAEELDGGRLP